MKLKSGVDIKKQIKGRVQGYFLNKKTGEIRNRFEKDNVITYTAADIMARLIGGDTTYIPKYMGFIYGKTGTPGAALIEPPVSRIQTQQTISAELATTGVNGNCLVTPLAASPVYAIDGSETYYDGNSVTLSAQSGARLEYVFPNATPYATALADGDFFWHAMLLTRLVSTSGTISYLPFSRVTLKQTTYLQKPVGFELAVFWTITFS